MLPISPRKDPTRNSADGFFQQSCSVEVLLCRSCWTTLHLKKFGGVIQPMSLLTVLVESFKGPFVIDSGWQHLTHLGCHLNSNQHCLELGWETRKFQDCKKGWERWKIIAANNFSIPAKSLQWTLMAWFTTVFTIFFLLVSIKRMNLFRECDEDCW